MGTFNYWEEGDAVSADFSKDEELSPEQAQVIATLQVAEQLSEIRDILKDMLELAQKELDRLSPN